MKINQNKKQIPTKKEKAIAFVILVAVVALSFSGVLDQEKEESKEYFSITVRVER